MHLSAGWLAPPADPKMSLAASSGRKPPRSGTSRNLDQSSRSPSPASPHTASTSCKGIPTTAQGIEFREHLRQRRRRPARKQSMWLQAHSSTADAPASATVRDPAHIRDLSCAWIYYGTLNVAQALDIGHGPSVMSKMPPSSTAATDQARLGAAGTADPPWRCSSAAARACPAGRRRG